MLKRLAAACALSLVSASAFAAAWSGSGTYYVGNSTGVQPPADYPTLSAFFKAMTGWVHGEGTINAVTAGATTITGTGTSFLSEASVGDTIMVGTNVMTISAIASDTQLTVSTGPTAAITAGASYTFKDIAPSAPAAVSGAVTVEILSDLTEPKNIPVIVNLASNAFTIKPYSATKPTVTFTRPLDQSGFSGHFLIGGALVNANAFVNTVDGFTIDGSNNGTTSRDLTLKTSVNYAFAGLVHIAGDNDNVVVKNANLLNLCPNTGSTVVGVRATSVVVGTAISGFATAGTHIPDNWKVENCYIRVIDASQGHGVASTNSGSVTTGQTGFAVTDSKIEAGLRGVFLNRGSMGNIQRNEISVKGAFGFDSHGIFLANAATPAAGTANYTHNQITVASPSHNSTAGLGPIGIAVTTAGSGADRVYNVTNNAISLILNPTSAITVQVEARGIQTGSAVTHNILHNTIYIPEAANVSGQTNGTNFNAVTLPGTTVAHTTALRNNIFHVAEQNAVAVARTGTGGTLTSNNNVFSLANGAAVAYTTANVNFTTWQGATNTPDLNSVEQAITADLNTTDLHWTSDPGASWKSAHNPGLNDIDLETRTSSPYYGADEYAANVAPTDIVLTYPSSLTIAENSANSTEIGILSGVDANPHELGSMTLTDNAGGRFSITRAGYTDKLVVASSALLDYESAGTHNVTAQFTDRAGSTYSEIFTVTITDVNEAPTDISLSNATINNTDSAGAAVGTLSSTDPDASNTFTYSLVSGTGSTHNTSFQLVSNELQAINANMAPGSYSVRVRSTDQGGLFFEEALTITVSDVTTPASSVTTSDATQVGPTIELSYTSSDTNGGGATNVALWVKAPGAGSFVDSGVSSSNANGTFSYTPGSATDGVYEFFTIATDGSNIEAPPASADVSVVFNDAENSSMQLTVAAANETLVFPMTGSLNATIALTGATPSGTITVDRETPRGALPTGLYHADRLVDERLDISGSGVGSFSATLTWEVEASNIGGNVGTIDTAYRAVSGALAETLSASAAGNVVTIPNVTAFSSWYVGNASTVPVTISGFVID